MKLYTISIRSRIVGLIAALLIVILSIAVTGLRLAAESNKSGRETYEISMKPVQIVSEVGLRMAENRSQIMLALQHNPNSHLAKLHDHSVTVHTDAIIANRDKITELWATYLKMVDDPDEKKLADRVTELRSRYVKEGLMPAMEQILAGDFEQAQIVLLKQINPLFNQATEASNKVAEFLDREVANRLTKNEAEFAHTRNMLIAGIALVFVLSLLAAYAVIRSIVRPVDEAVAIANKIAEGDFSMEIDTTAKDEVGQLLTALDKAVAAVKSMSNEAAGLAQAAVDGRLDTRADASKYQGEYRKIVGGVNDTLDAVIGPLNVAASYVDRISKGDIPPKIVDNYRGDFNTIKNNLNTCVDAVNALVSDANLLSKAAVEGKLATRVDASKHQGDFRKIVAGVNETLDAVIGPLDVAAKYVDDISRGAIPAKITDSYNGDFNTLKNNLNTCIDAVNALVADANMLSQAAVAGKLATRADAAKHQGDFRKIVAGVNDTLDNVVWPINEVRRIMEAM
ncbi:MAG TPA: Tar ligand binding domain-containing protein, partial [Rhodocyclaceae bacterium]|nr:Tar ligand binding domain-containing protein [Rhodocyclaceae bacterium]